VPFPFALEPLSGRPSAKSKPAKRPKKLNGQSPAEKVSV
jgi:hypothetical protein